ncbi:hypothetical protein D3C86_1919100 [compost metagenome]
MAQTQADEFSQISATGFTGNNVWYFRFIKPATDAGHCTGLTSAINTINYK